MALTRTISTGMIESIVLRDGAQRAKNARDTSGRAPRRRLAMRAKKIIEKDCASPGPLGRFINFFLRSLIPSKEAQ